MRRAMAAGLLALALVAPVPGAASPIAGPSERSTTSDPAYVIGPDDVLDVTYWREKDMSAEVVVRPDGFIALPLVGDVRAAGLTPAELTARIRELASNLLEFPMPTVTVKQINSRRVSITGEVVKPGRYPLDAAMTVLDLIALSGGLTEFADQKNIGIVRTAGGTRVSFTFNYKNASRLKGLHQNITLLPGDIVIVR